MDKNQPAPNHPASVVRDGNLKATLWENKSENGTYVSTTFAKTYEDKDGKPKDTNSFTGTDLLRISELARKAYALGNRIRREQAAEEGNQTQQQPAQTKKYAEHSL